MIGCPSLRGTSWLRASFVLSGLLFLAGCADGPAVAPGGETSAGQTLLTPVPQGPITLALLAPVSASNENAAALGQSLVNAAQIAMEDARDPQLQLRVYDTAGDPATAGRVAGQALAEGADLFLGPLFSANTRAVSQLAGPAGVKVIAFSTDTSVAGDPVYLSGYLVENEARRMISYAVARGYNTIGLFRPDTATGRAARAGALRAARSTGAQIVADMAYPRSFQGIQQSSQDFAAQAQGAQAILVPDGGQGLRSVAAFMDYRGLSPQQVKYLGLGEWNSRETLQEPALQRGWFAAPDPQRLADFARRYQARYNAAPNALAILGYDAVQIAGQMLQAARAGQAGFFDTASITRAQGFQVASGPIRFGPDGQSEHGLAILEVGPNRFDVIDPAPLSFDAGT